MSSWHREHPELVGTDADPWMIHASYARTIANPGPPRGFPGIDECERLAELEAYHCHQCAEDQPETTVCRECGSTEIHYTREP